MPRGCDLQYLIELSLPLSTVLNHDVKSFLHPCEPLWRASEKQYMLIPHPPFFLNSDIFYASRMPGLFCHSALLDLARLVP